MSKEIQTENINGYKISYINRREFEVISEDVFDKQVYKFETDKSDPFILDCGGHIGLAVMYYKKIWPNAKIISFEPNPDTFTLLKKNIEQNDLQDVTLVNAALGEEEGHMDFYIGYDSIQNWDSTDAGVKNQWYNEKDYKTIQVEQKKLSSFITQPVDFLKLDIEGMEAIVLQEASSKLNLVQNISMEYHGSKVNPDNSIEKIMEILNNAGFRTRILQDEKEISFEEIQRTEPYWLILQSTKVG